jgi:hypothetical protein
MVESRSSCRVLVEEPEEKRPLRSHALRWYDNIKMTFEEIEYVWKVCIV